MEILGAVVPKTRIFILVLAIVCVAVLAVVLKASPMGRRIRAVVQNRDLAETSGHFSRRTDITTFFIGSGLAGVAGVALTLIGSTSPTTGQSYLIDAFLVVVVGGLGQIKGTVIAAFALGILNSFIEYSTTASLAKVIVFVDHRGLPAGAPAGLVRRADKESRMNARRPLANSGWAGFALAAVAAVRGCAPCCSAASGSACSAKYLCYAIVAVGIGLAWGRGGMLTLGQGVFFGLGAYMMGMHLKIADAEIRATGGAGLHADRRDAGAARATGNRSRRPPSRCWRSSCVPTAVAALLGLGVFKRRVKGAYFAILSQALAAALAILLVGQARSEAATGSPGSGRSSGSPSTIRRTSRCCTSSPRPCC